MFLSAYLSNYLLLHYLRSRAAVSDTLVAKEVTLPSHVSYRGEKALLENSDHYPDIEPVF
jgi:hypothetical protein